MTKLLHNVLIVAASLTLAVAAQADTLEWAPPVATTRKKTLEAHHYLGIARSFRSIGTGPTIDDPLSGELSTWERLVFLDRYDEVADARVGRFVRRYQELASGGTANLMLPAQGGRPRPIKQTNLCATTMVGREVRFTWVPEEQGYARLWERLDGPEDFLIGVDHDLDLAVALPGREVESGDTWTIPAERAVAFLAPGGYRYFEPQKPTQFSRTQKVGAGGEVAALLAAPKGTIQATYEGLRKVDGRDFGVIKLELDLTSTADRREAFESVVPPEEAKDPRRLTGCTVETRFKATGEILWNVSGRHLHHYELKGTESVALRMAKQMVDEADQAQVINQVSELEGTFELSLSDAEPDPAPEAAASEQKD